MLKTIGSRESHAVISSVGATINTFVYRGENLIYPEGKIGEKSRGGIPICFPFFGKPPKNFSDIPQHGWLRKQELNLIEESEAYVVFSGVNERTSEFPWSLEYQIRVGILPTGCLMLNLITKRIKDGESRKAPINPGFHPYFCSNRSDDLVTKCTARIGSDVVTKFHKESVKTSVAEPILVRSGSRTLKMVLCGDFSYDSSLTLWSDNAEEYFCVEPVLTHPDLFNKPRGGKFLGEMEQSEMTMYLVVV